MPHSPPQAKKLPARPNLGYLKKLAKERLVELRRHHPASKLADAQLAVARDHGFESWRKLRADVVATLFQAALDDGDAKAMADLVRNYPSSALQRAALWTHPSGKRLPLPPLLIAACFRKNIDLVRALLDAGADPNSPALFVDGRPDIMTLLFDRGMNPNAMTHPENCTGLMYAAFVDDVENTELLLSRSADPNVVLPNCGTRALHWLPWRGENKTPDRTIAVGRMLIQSGADVNARIHTGLRDQPITDAGNLYLIEHGGSTVLHTAAEKGMLDLVRFLLEAGADPELRTTGNLLNRATLQYSHHLPGDRPLELAAAAGKLEVATLLRDRMLNTDERNILQLTMSDVAKTKEFYNRVGFQILSESATSLDLQFAGRQFHIKRAPRQTPGSLTKVGSVALHDFDRQIHRWRDAGVHAHLIHNTKYGNRVTSIFDPHGNIIDFFDPTFFDTNNPPPKTETFLTSAVISPIKDHRGSSLKDARQLLDEDGRVANASILTACVLGHPKDVKRWIETDHSLATRRGGPWHWRPLSYLTFSLFLRDEPRRASDFVDCARLLLQAGADPNTAWTWPSRPDEAESALYGAAGIANCAPLTKLLLDAGADVNDGEALYHASEFKDNAALRVLLEAKPRRDWVSYNLCHKMDMEDPAGVRLFIQHGADVNVLLERGLFKGNRPLHFAIYRRRSLNVFRILLNAGADPNLADDKGVTPYQLARKLGLNPVAKLLKSKGAADNLTSREQFLSALSSGDRKSARAMLRRNVALKNELTEADHKLLVNAAEAGNASAVRLMLDIGFPIATRGTTYGGWDATALDHAAWHGHAPIVRLLLKRGADPTVKHGYGGDALGAAIHGANFARHNRGLSAIKALAIVATTERLEEAIEYARTEANQKITAILEIILKLRVARTNLHP